MGVWKIHNGQLADMRKSGLTLREIGDKVGVSRQRIKQILGEQYGYLGIPLLTENKLRKIIGCPTCRLIKLRKQGIINPIHTNRFYLYDQREVDNVMLALQRWCVHCSVPLSIEHKSKYCKKCQEEYRRYAYPFLSEDAKNRCREASARWKQKNPSKCREIANRAVKKYNEKYRMRLLTYENELKRVYAELEELKAKLQARGVIIPRIDAEKQ